MCVCLCTYMRYSSLTGYIYLPIPDLSGSPGMVDWRLLNDLRTTPQSPSFPMFRVILHYLSF
jgi:hypothetical protein